MWIWLMYYLVCYVREDARCPSRDLGWQSSGVVEVEVAFLHTCPIILNMITENGHNKKCELF